MTPQEIKEQITHKSQYRAMGYEDGIDIDKLCEFLSTLTK